MKLVKIVKYQRVRYGDLDAGDTYQSETWPHPVVKPRLQSSNVDWIVMALDTDKYPPEVTYNFEGITAEEWEWMRVRQHGGRTVLIDFDESEIETRYI